MRTKTYVMVAAVLLTAAGARAQDASQAATPAGQQDVPKAQTAAAAGSEFAPVNEIDIGLRGTSFGTNSDQARFQRFRDLRDGGTLDRFRFTKENDTYGLQLQADHVGYRDQRFFGSYDNFGKLKASFEWNQTPLFYSETTRSLYTSSAPGVLVLPTGVQSGIQNKTLTLQNALTGASAFDLESKRSVADFNLQYFATPNVDWKVTVKNTLRDGSQPMSAGFGFSMATDELAAPIDTRTTDFGTSMEYSNDHGFARFGYDGSFFRNNIPTLTWANPLRFSDASGNPANGRLALWPNTDENTVSASAGLTRLPGRSHATAFISYGAESNNDTLIPFTINSAIASPALSRPTADVHARVTAMNFVFTSRPANPLWFSARYRQYKFDNQTTPFLVTQTVTYDASLSSPTAAPFASEPLGYTRHTFDADASYSPISFVGLRAGYTREVVDRTFRWIATTTEDVGRGSIDITGTQWLTVRGIYEHSKRRGTSLSAEQIIDEYGEQPTLGQYDIANRDRDRVTGILTVTPISMLSVSGSAGYIRDNFPNSYFGLRNSDNNVYTLGFDAVPIEDKVTFGVTYGYEKNTALQASRVAGHQAVGLPASFFDPRYDWFDDSADKTHTVDASMDVLKIIPKLDLRTSYNYSKGDSTYLYSLAAVTALPTPQQLPAVTNELQRGMVDVLYHLNTHLGAGLGYAYDKYSVNDFALGPQPNGLVPSPAASSPSIMMLGYYWQPYTANTFWGRLTYYW